MLSVIIPCLNEENNVKRIAAKVAEVLERSGIEFELIFINDGSQDGTWQRLQELAANDRRITAVDLSKNFGKESAIFAGLDMAKGDACVIMDCDMQHPPETIVEMYDVWKNNDVDMVEGVKADRGSESAAYRGMSRLFYKLINKASGLQLENSSDFRLIDRRVTEALSRMPERLTFFRAMSSWVGFRTAKVYFKVAEREDGESKFTLRSLIRYAVNSITSFTSAPMQIVTVCGLITFVISVIMGIDTLYNKFFGGSAEGFSTVIILQLLTSSIIMFSLGVIGFYLAKIYEEIKSRPRYIVRDIAKIYDDDKGEQA